MSVLVTGAGGHLGREVVRAFADDGPVVGLARRVLNVADRDAVHRAVSAVRPDIVVNCAAWTDVDGCEGDPERAHRINARAVGYLREAADEVGAHLVHVSTDFVFDGVASTPYGENDRTGPLNAYGASKLEGEGLAGPEATVVRTTWLQSADSPGMVERLLVALSGSGPVEMGDERLACPTFVADLVPVLWYLSEQRVPGVVHATNGGVTSWFGFAREVATAAGLDPGRISRTADPGLDGTLPARRPPFSALDNGVLRALGRPAIRHHGDAIAEAVARAVG
ncbi:MAG: sugar nucleotide-binding protein [Acidimicrobiaceae bacterium]|nr:sugar nucleotide-binding protein [Acidimicrobiaceae bacterium]